MLFQMFVMFLSHTISSVYLKIRSMSQDKKLVGTFIREHLQKYSSGFQMFEDRFLVFVFVCINNSLIKRD